LGGRGAGLPDLLGRPQGHPRRLLRGRRHRRGDFLPQGPAHRGPDLEGAADHQQIWAVAYTYDNWNGTKDTYDYFMITEVDDVWKFDGSLLIPQKMLDQAYSAKLTPQPTTQPKE